MNDSERIKKVLDYAGMSANKFSKHIGLNTSQNIYDIINSKHGISKVLAEYITVKYLNIDKRWLLTGEGEMLKSDVIHLHEPMAKYSQRCSNCAESELLIERLRLENESLKKQVANLEEIAGLLRERAGIINKQTG